MMTPPERPPRVIFVNRVFWPSEEATAQMLFDLATGLARLGHVVMVITASSGPSTWVDSDGTSLEIKRVGRAAIKRSSIGSKAVGYVDFVRHARRALCAECGPRDAVIIKTDPPLLGPYLGPLARKRGAKVFHWAQDIYPEVAMALVGNRLLRGGLGMLRQWRDREWCRSDSVVTLGADMGQLVRQRGVSAGRLHLVPNWAPAGLDFSTSVIQRTRWAVNPDELLLAYSGNLGRAHSLMPLIALADALANVPRVTIRIIGQGAQRAELEQVAQTRKLSNLRFEDPVPRAMLGGALAAADIHLVSLRPDCVGTVWPSKFYGIVAAGRPILFLGPKSSELYQTIETHELGLAIEPTEPLNRAVDWLAQLNGNPATYRSVRENVERYHLRLSGLAGAIQIWHNLLASPSLRA